MEATALRIRMEATPHRNSNWAVQSNQFLATDPLRSRAFILAAVARFAIARRHPMAGSRAAACVRERQTGATSAGT